MVKGGEKENMKNDNLYEKTVKVAQELYERSGRVAGKDLDNWLEAEKIVMSQYSGKEKIETEKYAAKKETIATKRRATKRA